MTVFLCLKAIAEMTTTGLTISSTCVCLVFGTEVFSWYCGMDSFASIQASVIQGSGLGPAAFLIRAADLFPLYGENRIIRYADDTYLNVPACNANTSYDELEHIRKWATKNNLTLKRAKTKEILFRANVHPDDNTQIPPDCQGTQQEQV